MRKMKKPQYNVAVVGAGVVGIEMLRLLKQRNFPIGELRVFARSAREIEVDGRSYPVREISPQGFEGIDITLFAGTEGEKGAAVTYAAEAVKRGAVVIDNGADFRMDPKVPLVVPEVNPKDINPVRNWFRGGSIGISNEFKKHKGIIANPNCSTIQMVVALAPIHKKAGIKRVIVTTFQASSGAGKGAVEQLKEENSMIAANNLWRSSWRIMFFRISEVLLRMIIPAKNGSWSRKRIKLCTIIKLGFRQLPSGCR
jgi:aspartate-semialdehyde dehydrogenase